MPSNQLSRRLKALAGIFKGRDVGSILRMVSAVVIKNLREIRLRLELGIEHLHGPKKIKGRKQDVIALCLFRDGQIFLPQFLEHHRQMGVTHFVFMDNGSQDGSVEYIRNQPDTTLYSSRLPFGKYKSIFKRYLIRKHGRNRWALLLDIDESFDFPHSEKISLSDLIVYLEEHECTAVAGHMLDVYSDKPILSNPPANEKTELEKHYHYYDLTGLIEEDYSIQFGKTNKKHDEDIHTLSGGVRHTFFGNTDLLTKHPLFCMDKGMGATNSGHDITHATVADLTTVLYHYKFTSSFSAVLRRAINEGGYYRNSNAYHSMAKRLEKDPELTLVSSDTREVKNASELVDAGFLRASKRFTDWVNQRILEDSGKEQGT